MSAKKCFKILLIVFVLVIFSKTVRAMAQQPYMLFKKAKQQEFRKQKLTFFEQLNNLLENTSNNLSNTNDVFNSYNYLRELLLLKPVETIYEIDSKWLEEVSKEINYLNAMELNEYKPANLEQRELARQAKAAIQLGEDIMIYAHPSQMGGESNKGVIAVCRNPDLDYTLGLIYHELGHIVHQDDDKHKKTITDAQNILNSPEMKQDRAHMQNYLRIGKSALLDNAKTSKSRLSKILLNQIPKTDSFWDQPVDRKKYIRALLFFDEERRADLFMLEKLYELGNINAIISQINYFANLNKAIAASDSVHPAPLERALYMIGFLKSKKLEVDALLKEWEHKGTCISREIYTSDLKKLLPTAGAQVVQDVYNSIWQKEEQEGYKRWKRNEMGEFLKRKLSREEQILHLLSWSAFYLTDIQDDETELLALDYYNFARELLGLPIVSTSKLIDKQWLAQKDYSLWKNAQKTKIRPEKISQALLVAIKHNKELIKKEKDPAINFFAQRARLYSYNMLRELLNRSTALSLAKINYAWLNEQEKI